jgi:hypothetical protein
LEGAVTVQESAPQVCAVKVPPTQDVAEPVTWKPLLHANWQLVPEARTDEHVPKVPLTGAVTEQLLRAQVWAARDPLAQDVAAPVNWKPALHASWQLAPEARLAEHEPSVPLEGAVTAHALGAQVSAAATGVVELVVVPSPSWPSTLTPQHSRLAPGMSAQLW